MRRPWLVAGLVGVTLLLHQDAWNWTDGRIVLGLLPVGLAWHVGYSLLAAGVMALLVRLAWPADLEDEGDRR